MFAVCCLTLYCVNDERDYGSALEIVTWAMSHVRSPSSLAASSHSALSVVPCRPPRSLRRHPEVERAFLAEFP